MSLKPAVIGRKGNANRWQGFGPVMAAWRKPEAEPVYVANSEPAIWVRGGGRADVDERVPISDWAQPKCTEAGRHTGRSCVLPREALCLGGAFEP